MNRLSGVVLVAGLFTGTGMTRADILAQWTFESTRPTSAGPILPEIGTGSATSVHNSTGTPTYTSGTNSSVPSGDGSAFAWGSTLWNSNGNDYWQFEVTTGDATNLTLSFDQVSSATGPNKFQLSYSVDGGKTFVNVGNPYTVNANSGTGNVWNSSATVAADHYAPDLSSFSSDLDDAGTVIFRLTVEATQQAGTGTQSISSGGYNVIDNVIITGMVGNAVPEPATLSIAFAGAALGLIRRVRHAAR